MKFKVGDKVRFIRDNQNGGSDYGARGEVVEVVDTLEPLEVRVRTGRGGFNPRAFVSDLELVSDLKEKVEAGLKNPTASITHIVKVEFDGASVSFEGKDAKSVLIDNGADSLSLTRDQALALFEAVLKELRG